MTGLGMRLMDTEATAQQWSQNAPQRAVEQNAVWNEIHPGEKLWGLDRNASGKPVLAISKRLMSEEQAQKNHGQSLDRIDSRGGADPKEALHVIRKESFQYTPFGVVKPSTDQLLGAIMDEADKYIAQHRPVAKDTAQESPVAAKSEAAVVNPKETALRGALKGYGFDEANLSLVMKRLDEMKTGFDRAKQMPDGQTH